MNAPILCWLLAHLMDLALERSPYSERGFLAGTIVWWAVAAFVVSRTLRGSLAGRRVLEAASSHGSAQSPRASQHLKEIVQFSAGALVMIALAGLFGTSMPRPELPEGWKIIRAPYSTRALAVQGDTVWASGVAGITALDRASGAVIETSLGRSGFRGVTDLDVAGTDLWIAHYGGVTRYRTSGESKTFGPEEGMLPGPATALFRDRAGHLWVGTKLGVARFDGRSWRSFTTRDGLAAPRVDVVFQDRTGVMWFGCGSPTNGGLSRYDGRAWSGFTVADGLAHSAVNDILQDRHGAIWVGTGYGREGGASRLVNGRWTTITRQDGLAGEKVRSLHEDAQGRLWFGSEYDGLAVQGPDGWHIVTPREGLAGWEVLEIVRDRDGVYWLGTENGVNRIENAAALLQAGAGLAATRRDGRTREVSHAMPEMR